MWPFRVVDGDRLTDHMLRLLEILRYLKQELLLQNAIAPLCQGVLIAVIAVGHRADQSVFLVNGLVLMGAVLNATVRMMDQRSASLAALECHLQGLANLCRVQAVMDVVTNDLAGVSVGHQT